MANLGSNVVVNIEANASQFDVGMHRAKKATKDFENQTKKTNGQLRLMRGGFGQVGHQIQDVAVQLQAGQNGLLVFGQQGSQIASLFGPRGAMIGAVLAVGAAIGTAFLPKLFGATEAMKALKEATNGLEDRFDSLTIAQQDFVTDDVQRKIRENNDLLEDKKDALATAERKQKDLSDSQSKQTSILGKLTNAFKNYSGGSQFNIGVTQQNIESQEDLSDTIRTLKKDIDTINEENEKYNEIIDGVTTAYLKQNEALKKQIKTFGLEGHALRVAGIEADVLAKKITRKEGDKLKARSKTLAKLETDAEREKQIAQEVADAYTKAQQDATKAMQAKEKSAQSFANGMASSFTNAIQTAETFKDVMKAVAASVVDSLITMIIQKQIADAIFGVITTAMNPGGVIGAAETSPNFIGPQLPAGQFNYDGTPAFAGGGFTGMGARSGGVDGKGGFPAILHPNETVVDHSQGQTGGVVVNQTINISTGVQQTVRAEIQNLMPQITSATKSAVADARIRGGAFSKQLVGA